MGGDMHSLMVQAQKPKAQPCTQLFTALDISTNTRRQWQLQNLFDSVRYFQAELLLRSLSYCAHCSTECTHKH